MLCFSNALPGDSKNNLGYYSLSYFCL
uniref:Uncharacterized protein n=1 Tax=Arundo donax TaxID=35708 RepID=A0A0A9E5K5_ARUDO